MESPNQEKKVAISQIEDKLNWMQKKNISKWIKLSLDSLYYYLSQQKYLESANDLISNVYQVLGRSKGLRIGEESDRDGQYFHYLTKWMYALYQMGKIQPEFHEKTVKLVKDIHSKFVIKGVGVQWKMLEDLSGEYPGFGFGGLDYYDGYCMYKIIDSAALSSEIGDMHDIIKNKYLSFSCTQDLGLGEVLWLCHFFPEEEWSQHLYKISCQTLDSMWIDKGEVGGYFCRHPSSRNTKFAFTNFGVSIGLQSVNLWPERVKSLNKFFLTYKSNDEYDTNSITHVMHCTSLFPGVFNKDFNS